MGWTGGPVDERIRLMKKWESGKYSVTELAALAGVTRQCLHKWLRRWRKQGEAGMVDLSRAPLRPRRTPADVVAKLIELKKAYHSFGAEKLVAMMCDRDGVAPLGVSTAEKILEAHGLVKHRRRRERVGPPSSAPRRNIPSAGHTMTADHKGYFQLGNGSYCYPLTVVDPISRYLFAIDAQARPDFTSAWKVFDRLFREFGLPDQILTDNGVPFCSARSLGGLTELSKRWIKLGIHVARIDAGRPQQNGRHERLHRTLEDAATLRPVPRSLRAAQHRFDAFRYEYNCIRPHQELGLSPPSTALVPFGRSYTGCNHEVEYPSHMDVRRVRSNGQVKIGGRLLFVSEVLINECVGLDEVDDQVFEIYFGSCLLGYVDARRGVISRDADEVLPTR